MDDGRRLGGGKLPYLRVTAFGRPASLSVIVDIGEKASIRAMKATQYAPGSSSSTKLNTNLKKA
jgi:hypothetical protein